MGYERAIVFKPDTIYFGDNIEIMRAFPDECIDLIYADPLFNSGSEYGKFRLRNNGHIDDYRFKDTYEHFKETAEKYGENGHPECDMNNLHRIKYIDNMIECIKQMHRILKSTGSIFLHCDTGESHYLKQEMDRVFNDKKNNDKNFMSEIIWHYAKMGNTHRNLMQNHDVILYYVKNRYKEYVFNEQYDEVERALYTRYKHLFNSNNQLTYAMVMAKKPEILMNNYLKTRRDELERDLKPDDIILDFSIKEKRKKCDDVWNLIPKVKGNSKENKHFETQKPEALLERLLSIAANKGNIVLDPFSGSGTTAFVAKKLGMHFIAIDENMCACELTARRLWINNEDIDGFLPEIDFVTKIMSHGEFETWGNIKVGAIPTSKIPGRFAIKDRCIDGIVGNKGVPITEGYEGYPVQVKHMIARVAELRELVGSLPSDTKKAVYVALGYTKDAMDYVLETKRDKGIDIKLITASELCNYQGHLKPSHLSVKKDDEVPTIDTTGRTRFLIMEA